MPTLQQAFEAAVRHHQAGQLAQAETLYRQILAQQPDHADALHLLGVIAHQSGRADMAADLIGRAITLKPDFSAAHNSLGIVLKGTGRIDQAIAAFRQAIALRLDYAEAHSNLGVALKDKGELEGAITAYRRALAFGPNSAQTWGNLGNALSAKGEWDEAIASYRQAIALRPNFPEAFSNLGSCLKDKGELDEAIVACRRAIALRPGYPEAHLNLGVVLKDKGEPDEAIAAYQQAIALRPDYSEAYSNLGVALLEKGWFDEAIAACRRAIALRPDYFEGHANLSVALEAGGRVGEAVAACWTAIALKPDAPEGYNNLGNTIKTQGQLDDAIAACRRAIALRPDYPEAHSNLAYFMHYHPGYGAATIAEEHRRWNRQHAEPLRQAQGRPHVNDRDPDRRLRIGYVSPDMREHPVGRFLLPLLAHHNHESFEIVAYSHVHAPDSITNRLRSAADQWRSITGLSDDRAADLIRKDQIDILVDLAGHTGDNRLLVFARKPAPVQVTWLGYPNSTGLSAIDYRLTDAYADPLGKTEAYHCEQLIRLSPCAWCFYPTEGPPVAPRKDTPITFGSFNNFAKVTEPTLRLWGRILLAVPGSRILLKANGLGSEEVRQRVRRLLSEDGIGPDRVELRGHEPGHLRHLALYDQVDIALDTFPYHGTTTTCEALWMGVPVVSLAGDSHVSRVGVSLLSNAGVPELIANDPDEYVRLALDLANDRTRLAHLRSTLRQRMEQSPLMDAPGFARGVESAYRRMWRTWCKG